jgi:hypothetical protein
VTIVANYDLQSFGKRGRLAGQGRAFGTRKLYQAADKPVQPSGISDDII